jgi:hypothetical protein
MTKYEVKVLIDYGINIDSLNISLHFLLEKLLRKIIYL